MRGPWPPDDSSRQEATPTDDAIRARADQLAKRRPWCSAEQNWTDACLELNSAFLLRWRPTLLRWLGASEKTGWDWMELSLKLSVPLTIALGGWFLGTLNSNRQNEIAQANQKDAVIREYIKEMKGMLLDKTVAKEAKQPGSEANGVARALTLTALTQLKGEGPARRTLVFQFLRESNFPILAGSEVVQGANLAGYDLSGADLSEASLGRANLSGADLSEANLGRANLSEANLGKADLSGADLGRANLSGASLRGADLRGADLSGADLDEANLSGANLGMANLRGADLSEGDLDGANLSGANLGRANLRGAIFDGANLSGASLGRANIRGAYLVEANLRGANLRGADLRGADLSGANLSEADLSGANLRGAKFKDTICPDRKETDTGCSITPARQ